jgi:hypothetical protein
VVIAPAPARDAPPLASGTRPPQVDQLPLTTIAPSIFTRPRAQRIDPAPGARELVLGIPPHPGRSAQARAQLLALTVGKVLRPHRIPPAPRRGPCSGASSFASTRIRHWPPPTSNTVDTVWLQSCYVLFFIEVGSRQIYVAGITAHPSGESVTQQARHISRRWLVISWRLATRSVG